MNPTRTEYRLTLRAVPAGADRFGRTPEYRLRTLLKRALRDHGLKCIQVAQSSGDAEPVAQTEGGRQ